MKFTFSREKLQKALSKVGSILGTRPMLPLIGNVMIEAADGKINLSDALRLRKYLANRDPVTGESSVVLGPQ